MSEQNKPEPIFVDGLMFRDPKENAPAFIKGRLSANVKKLCEFLQKHDNNGWVNFDLKQSTKGTMYFQLDTWKPKQQENTMSQADMELEALANTEPSSIPF